MKRTREARPPKVVYELPEDWRSYPPLELTPMLQVAVDHIVRQGYHATSVRTIANEVGVTVPALYYHFENKQAILIELLDLGMNIVTVHIDAALQEVGDEPVARLSALVEALVLFTVYHRDLAFLDTERRSLDGDNFAEYVSRRDRIEEQLREIVASGQRAGLFGNQDVAESSRAIFTMCQGIAGWYRRGGPATAEEIASRYVTIALAVAGYRAPHAP